MSDSNDPVGDPGPRRQLIAAVAVLALLLAVSLWLTGALRGAASIQDCAASGRTNCAPIDTPPRSPS